MSTSVFVNLQQQKHLLPNLEVWDKTLKLAGSLSLNLKIPSLYTVTQRHTWNL